MKPHQISIGLSSIKLQLIRKLGLNKDLNEMNIWFSLEDGVLYVHDFNKHKSCMVIALVSNRVERCFLNGGHFDVEVVHHGYNKSIETKTNIAEAMNKLYNSDGFWGFG
jgi:hypothetical protein